jgi:uncharacterized membrane protein YeaQ/YmgE (transglycosylase-associated protein family)
MIDITFWEFLTLAIMSLIATLIVHNWIHYHSARGAEGFWWQWIAGWVFAWLGSPVFGHWVAPLRVQNVYLIPALLGGFVGAFCAAVLWRGSEAPQKTTI